MTPKTWGSVRLKPKLAPDADSNKLLGPGVNAATAAKVKKERSVVESTTDDPKNDRIESIAEMSYAPMTDPRHRVPTSDARRSFVLDRNALHGSSIE